MTQDESENVTLEYGLSTTAGWSMDLPHLKAAICAIPITLSLWSWTRTRAGSRPMAIESRGFYRQSRLAQFAFSGFFVLELVALLEPSSAVRWTIASASAAIFVVFSILSETREGRFWSKERNRLIGVSLTALATVALAFIIEEIAFLPLFAALAISSTCHSRMERELESQGKDIETLHAKLLKQEAQQANERHFGHPLEAFVKSS